MEVIKEEFYRSTPYVNTTDDMVRVTLTCTRNEWRVLKEWVQNGPYKDEEGFVGDTGR